MKRVLIGIIPVIFFFCFFVEAAVGQTDLVNIAPLASITSRPGGRFLKRTVDGFKGTGYWPSPHGYIPNKTFYFRFSEAQPVRKIRFTLPPNYYSIWADTNGDGNFDKEIITVDNGPTSKLWGVSEWTYGEWQGGPVSLYSLKMDYPSIYKFAKTGSSGTPPQVGDMVYQWNTSGVRQHRSGTVIAMDDSSVLVRQSDGEGWTWGSSGWIAASATDPSNRWVYSEKPTDANPRRFLYEFEVYCSKSELSQTALAAYEAYNNPVLDPDAPAVSYGSTLQVKAPSLEQQFMKGMYIEVWMMAFAQWITQKPRRGLREWRSYQDMLYRLQEIGANFVWMMPIRSGYEDGEYTGDWYNSEVLWPSNYIASSSPENYLKIIADALHKDGIKFFAGDRPSAWTAKKGVNQKDVWPGAVSEMTSSGIDGAAVIFDETGNQANEDQLSQYSAAANIAHALNPDILTFTNMQVPSGTNRTFPKFAHWVDTDLLGTEGYFTLDDPWGHWTPAFHTEEMLGANPNRGSILTQNTAWAPAANNPLFYETFTPVCLYGPTLSTYFHGGTAISYWRLRFQNDDYTRTHVPKGYSMADTLASWGGSEAVVPDDILVIGTDRQAERFVYYDYVYHLLPDFPDANKTGYYNTEAVFEILLRAGLPYRVRYIDYPAEFPDLSKTKLIILPFAYVNSNTEYSQAAIDYLQAAANRGVKIVVLHRDGVHQYYKTYAGYDSLIQSPNVTVVSDNLSYGVTPAIRSNVLAPVFSALGTDRHTYLNAYNNDIELASLKGTGKNKGSKYLLVTNWANHPVTVDVGIKMDVGDYLLLERNITEAKKVLINGRELLSEKDLAKFRVSLSTGEAKIFYISWRPNSGDVSGDQEISAYDAALVIQHFSGLTTLTPGQVLAGDVTGDGKLDYNDAALIAQRASGGITEFPVDTQDYP